MEPFLTFALINTAINAVVRPVGNLLEKKFDGKKKEAIELKDYQHKLDLDMLRATKEYELLTKQQLQQESHAQRLKEATYQYEIHMKKWQDQSFDQRVWPLKTPYENFSLKPIPISEQNDCKLIPCRIFAVKTNKEHEYSRYLENTVNVNLSMFLEKGYGLDDTHPAVSSIGDWKNDEYQEDTFINALWYGLQGQPVIVLNPVTTDNGNTLNLRVTFWGLGTNGGYSTPRTTTVAKLDFGRERGHFIREESIHTMECGMTNISQELKFNYDLIQSEENAPLDKRESLIEKNMERYRLAAEVVNAVNRKLSRQVSEIMRCFTGLYCDVYHLIEYGTAPIMPEKMLQTSPEYQLPSEFGKLYQGTLARLALSGYHGRYMKEIYIKTALALLKHPSFQTQAYEIFREGVGLYVAEKAANQNEIMIPADLESCVESLDKHSLQLKDMKFFNEVSGFLHQTGYTELEENLQKIISNNMIANNIQIPNKRLPPSGEKGNADKRIPVLGLTASGKTTYLAGMYNVINSGSEGFKLIANLQTGSMLKEIWMKMNDTSLGDGRFPPPTNQSSRLKFKLEHGYSEIKNFDLVEYPDDEITKNPDIKEQVLESIKESGCIMLCLDGSDMKGEMDDPIEHTFFKSASEYLGLLEEFEAMHGYMPAVIFIITKYDKCTRGIKITEIVKEAFSPLFNNDGQYNKLVAVIPVTLGRNVTKNGFSGKLEPVNVKLPVLLAIWNMVHKEIKEAESIQYSLKKRKGKEPVSVLDFFKKDNNEYPFKTVIQTTLLNSRNKVNENRLFLEISSALKIPVYLNGKHISLEDLRKTVF